MNREILIALVNNAALLLSLGVIYDLVSQMSVKFKKQTNLITGLLVGGCGIIVMATPLVFTEGLIFDTRTVLISVSAYFFGPVSTLVAVLMTSIYRMTSGGIGVLPGVTTIVSSALIGLGWRRYHDHTRQMMTLKQAYWMGLLVTLVSLLNQFTLPYPYSLEVISKIALPLLLINPVMTVLLSMILLRKHRVEQLMRQKLESDAKYKLLFEKSRAVNLLIDPDSGRIIDCNPAASEMYGWSPEQFKKLSVYDFNTLSPAEIAERIRRARQNNQYYFEMKHRLADGSIRDVEVYSGPIEIDGKRSLYSIIHDVTQRKQYEETITQQTQTLQQTMQSIVVLLTSMIDLRDPYTAGHQRRVGNLAAAIAAKLNQDQAAVDRLRTIGYLHDIGKLVVPSDILSRPGKLNDLELGLIKTHVDQGFKMLNQVAFPGNIAEVVYQHHERLDGSGYPRGLKDAEILDDAAVIALADVVESMLSHRPYRKAFSLETTLAEITTQRGVLYRPAVVDACYALFTEDNYRLDDEVHEVLFQVIE